MIAPRPNRDICDDDRTRNVTHLKAQKARIESFGMKLEEPALDVGPVLLGRPAQAKASGNLIEQYAAAYQPWFATAQAPTGASLVLRHFGAIAPAASVPADLVANRTRRAPQGLRNGAHAPVVPQTNLYRRPINPRRPASLDSHANTPNHSISRGCSLRMLNPSW